MEPPPISTHETALQINLDPTKYGTFAETGAGQEAARWRKIHVFAPHCAAPAFVETPAADRLQPL